MKFSKNTLMILTCSAFLTSIATASSRPGEETGRAQQISAEMFMSKAVQGSIVKKGKKKISSEFFAYPLTDNQHISQITPHNSRHLKEAIESLDESGQSTVTSLLDSDKAAVYELDNSDLKIVVHLATSDSARELNLQSLKVLSQLASLCQERGYVVSVLGDININTFGDEGRVNMQDVAALTGMVVFSHQDGVTVTRPDNPFYNGQFVTKYSGNPEPRETMAAMMPVPENLDQQQVSEYIAGLRKSNPDLNITFPDPYRMHNTFVTGRVYKAFSAEAGALNYRDHFPLKVTRLLYEKGSVYRKSSVIADNQTTILDPRKGFVESSDWIREPSAEAAMVAAKLARKKVTELHQKLQELGAYSTGSLEFSENDSLRTKAKLCAKHRFVANGMTLADEKVSVIRKQVLEATVELLQELEQNGILESHSKDWKDPSVVKAQASDMIGDMMKNILRTDKMSLDYFTNILFTRLHGIHVGGQDVAEFVKMNSKHEVLLKQLQYIQNNYQEGVVFAVEANNTLNTLREIL